MKCFNGYSIKIIYDGDDWHATIPKLPWINAYGEVPEDALDELRIIWDGYIQRCIAREEEPPMCTDEEERWIIR
jgi:predicted RNase H-like HicB family nuclease